MGVLPPLNYIYIYMTTKNYRYYERGYFDLYNITYNDTTTFGQGKQSIGKSKLYYNKITGLGVLKLDFDFLKAPNLVER